MDRANQHFWICRLVKAKLHISYPVPRSLGRRAQGAIERTDAAVYHHASAFGGSHRSGAATEDGVHYSAYAFPSLKNAKIALASIRKIKIPKAMYKISQRGMK